MKKDSHTRNIDGYMTLEASLVFPIIIYIITCLIYMGFLVYDETLAFQQCYMAGLEAVSVKRDNQAIYNKASDQLHSNEWFVALENHQDEIAVKGNEIDVNCKGTIDMPFLANGIFPVGQEFWNYEVKTTVEKRDAPFWIRQCRKMEE